MATESIYFTENECNYIKSCIAKKLAFIVKKSSNKKEVIFEGAEIPQKHRNTWKGKDYFVSCDFYNFNGSFRGRAYATVDFKDFESLESINALIDERFDGEITDDEKMLANQISLFD